MSLALLNLGGEEILLVLLLLVLFFGAEKIPQIARQLGHWRAQFDAAKERAAEELRAPDERELDEQLEFERAREHQMAQQQWDEPPAPALDEEKP